MRCLCRRFVSFSLSCVVGFLFSWIVGDLIHQCVCLAVCVCMCYYHYVLSGFCLSVCLAVIRNVPLDKEEMIKYWKTSTFVSGSRNFQNCSTLQDRAFFYKLLVSHSLEKNCQELLKILSSLDKEGPTKFWQSAGYRLASQACQKNADIFFKICGPCNREICGKNMRKQATIAYSRKSDMVHFWGDVIAQSLFSKFTAYPSLESTCIGLIGRKLYCFSVMPIQLAATNCLHHRLPCSLNNEY